MSVEVTPFMKSKPDTGWKAVVLTFAAMFCLGIAVGLWPKAMFTATLVLILVMMTCAGRRAL